MRLEELFADERRRESEELALGGGWVSNDDDAAEFAVYWIEQTEDVYAVRHPVLGFGPGTVKPYGAYVPRMERPDEDAEARLLGRADRQTYDEIARDLEAAPSERRSLQSLAERLRS